MTSLNNKSMHYQISHNYDPKVIGVKTGLAQIEIKKDSFNNVNDFEKLFDFFHFQKYLDRENKIPNFPILISRAHLLKSAKITDFMTFSPNLLGIDFIISEKVYEIIKKLNMPESYYYPIIIYDKETRIEETCYLFYSPFLNLDLIDFKKSKLYTGFKTTKKYLSIDSPEEYKKSSNPLIDFDMIFLKDKDLEKSDYINLQSGGQYVSERFRKIILETNLTGLIISNDGNKLNFGTL